MGGGNGPARPKRARPPLTYDEVERRGPHTKRQCGYMERGSRGGHSRTATAIGAAAIERVVRGAYQWRDAGHTAVTGALRRWWAASATDEARRDGG